MVSNLKKQLLLLLLASQFIWSQQPDPRQDMMNFAPGKIIVKLKDNVNAKVSYTSKGVGTTAENIGKLLGIEKKVSGTTLMFSQQSVEKSTMRKQSGFKDSRLKEVHSLKNTFVLDLKDAQEDVLSLAEDLKKNPAVEYAEPDYRFSVNDFTVDSKIYTEADLKNQKTSTAIVTPNDPLYSQQSNITATHINEVWNTYGTGNGSQTIAILDTGVDYNHPDLQVNTWTNTKELNGIAGFDDDGNGFIDDIRGWDFINNDNAPLDDNMHGTHVAGIAGAIGGNSIGIAGAAWNVKLMPIKVLQSNGVGNASTIALAIQYASNNGATIINMSFGSYAESFTMRNALENAYGTSVLVAAAGNNGIKIGPCPPPEICIPLYPGAYSFVLGVEDTPRPPIGYTNYDQDGPVFSGYPTLLNYELKAPGTSIMSTVPGGGYRNLTGTSMSAPLVSGGIALYLQQKPNDSKELLFGNLINTSNSFVNFKAAVEITPKPELKVLSAITKDNSIGQNGNGFIEPGETVDIFPLIKNYWGPSNDVRVGIEFAEFEDNTKATILTPEIAIGSITAYATLQDLTKSIKIKIADGVANNVNISFNLKVWSGDAKEYLTSVGFVVNVVNTHLITGHYKNQIVVLKKNEHYLVGGICVLENTTMIIEPGVLLEFDPNMTFMFIGSSHWEAKGTPDNKITIRSKGGLSRPTIPLGSKYAPNWSWSDYFQNMNDPMSGYTFSLNNENSLNNTGNFPRALSVYEFCIFENVNTRAFEWGGNAIALYKNCVFNGPNIVFSGFIYKSTINNPGNYGVENDWNSVLSGRSDMLDYVQYKTYNNYIGVLPNYLGNATQKNSTNNILLYSDNIDRVYNLGGIDAGSINQTWGNPNSSPPSFGPFMGPSSIKMFKSINRDIFSGGPSGGIYDWDNSNIKLSPYEEAHALVWKVEIDGFNAFDDYLEMNPIGVGNHKFDIYFNREMDRTRPPRISYGVREPYTQKIISENGTWSTDGKIYTVTHEVKIGAADGINRIRVQGARDLDYFDIPIENYRFNMLLQSAGSASVGFEATPGLGKIALDWAAPAGTVLEDVLGYNMYRYKANADGTFTEPVKVNETLIATTAYTDFDVAEGKTYYYKYKILRTSFEETDYSMTVAASPLTSKLGDSNGDFTVNVMDLVQSVDYILGNNPTPYIVKAADVNNDQSINVLDIVGTVDIILNPRIGSIASNNSDIKFYSNQAVGDATFYWEGNDLFVESDHAIGGLQLAFNTDFEYTKSAAIASFEALAYTQDDQKVIMIYSFNGTALPAGKTKLLTKNSAVEGLLDISKAVVGMPNGSNLNAYYKNSAVLGIDAPMQTNFSVITSFYPNPTSGNITVQYYLPEPMDKVAFSVFDLQGKRIWNQNDYKNTSGYNTVTLDLNSLSNNIYFVVMDVERNGELKDRVVKKLIVKK